MSINPGGVATHPFPYSQTLTLLRRVRAEPNEYGNDTFTSVAVEIPYCVVQPGNSSENMQWTDQVTTSITVFVPYGTEVNALDAFLIDGNRYEVQGVSQEWRSPFSGHTSPLQVSALLVSGASLCLPNSIRTITESVRCSDRTLWKGRWLSLRKALWLLPSLRLRSAARQRTTGTLAAIRPASISGTIRAEARRRTVQRQSSITTRRKRSTSSTGVTAGKRITL